MLTATAKHVPWVEKLTTHTLSPDITSFHLFTPIIEFFDLTQYQYILVILNVPRELAFLRQNQEISERKRCKDWKLQKQRWQCFLFFFMPNSIQAYSLCCNIYNSQGSIVVHTTVLLNSRMRLVKNVLINFLQPSLWQQFWAARFILMCLCQHFVNSQM